MNPNEARNYGAAGFLTLVIFAVLLGTAGNQNRATTAIASTVATTAAPATSVAAMPTATTTKVPATATRLPASPTAQPTLPPTMPPSATVVAAVASPTAQATTIAGAVTPADSGSAYDAKIVAQGKTLFVTCAACHGPDAKGLKGLGKNLVASEFIGKLSDKDLLTFIKTGRPSYDPANTTGVDMPAKGGNPALTDNQILSIIAYVRTLRGSAAPAQGAAQGTTSTAVSTTIAPTATRPAPSATPQTATQTTSAPATNTQATKPASSSAGTGDVTQGKTLFVTCAACHGPDAKGLKGLGKNLVASEFIGKLSDKDLLTFIKTGRPSYDPANTTGVDMPAKGGNPTLTDNQILNIIAYVRSLRDTAGK